MPKAKFKRKGAPLEVLQRIECEDRNKFSKTDGSIEAEILNGDNPVGGSCIMLLVPEEIICMILDHLSVLSIARVEQTCKHLRTVINQARVWRKLLLNILEREPGLVDFIPDVSTLERNNCNSESSVDPFKRLFCELKLKLDNVWSRSDCVPSISRTHHVYGQVEEDHFLYHVVTSGRHLLSFWGPIKTEDSRANKEYLIDVYDRQTLSKVKRLVASHGKPDIVRVVSDINMILISYPGFLMVEIIRLDADDGEDRDYLDLNRSQPETGSVCDIVVRENVSIQGVAHTRVLMVAVNTEPLDNRQQHIGVVMLYGMSSTGELSAQLWKKEFSPVPTTGTSPGPARFYNQCIQKKGLSDLTSNFVVVVVGGCEGSAVLAVVDVQSRQVLHKKQLRGEVGVGVGGVSQDLEGGCEGGACQFSVVSLMIDKNHPEYCTLLLSTGQLSVIDLSTANTIFHRHLQFDGQLKLALHQPRLLGTQRIAIKFRNFVSFYDLYLHSEIYLEHVRTLRITSVDGRETRLDDNPSQELRKQFGELQKRVRALNNYTSGIQKKLDKGLRPGTVTQGVLSMTRKVQLVTSKLDQAHGKAREIEAIVIASIAFDNRYCHALTLNRDLVVFDMLVDIDVLPGLQPSSRSSGAAGRSRITRARAKHC